MVIVPGAFTLVDKCPNHYATDDHDFSCEKLIQYEIENLSLKNLQMEEVGNCRKHIICP
jgi:hypothetical protein